MSVSTLALLASMATEPSPWELRFAAVTGFVFIEELSTGPDCDHDCSTKAGFPVGFRIESSYRAPYGFGFGAAARWQNYGFAYQDDPTRGSVADIGGVISWSSDPIKRRGYVRLLVDVVAARITPTGGDPRVTWGWDFMVEGNIRLDDYRIDSPAFTIGGGVTSLRVRETRFDGGDGIVGLSMLLGFRHFL